MSINTKQNRISRIKLSNLLSDKRDGKSVREFIREKQEFGIAPHAWRAWESGETKPNSDNLIKLANLFEMSLEDFLDAIEEKEGEVVEFKNPIRIYRKKATSETVYKNENKQNSLPLNILTEEEKTKITTRLLFEYPNKNQLLLDLLGHEPSLLSEVLDYLPEYKNQNVVSFLKSLLNNVKLEKEEKITLATFLLNDVASAE